MLLMASALGLGFLHGLGSDHLMGIAALSIGATDQSPAAQRARALGIAVRFAAGHALMLALGAGVLLALGWSLPLAVERGGEMLGGTLLVVLGGIGLWGVATGHVYGHAHRHGDEPAAHWHLHIGRPDRHPLDAAHSHLPTIVGAAFAISSLRALTLLTPFGERAASSTLPVLLGLIAIFGFGILLSMSLFGILFARVMSTAAMVRIGRAAGGAMAMASIGLGVFWIAQA
jgi:nickel/cobalt transporter (NicO) family protein